MSAVNTLNTVGLGKASCQINGLTDTSNGGLVSIPSSDGESYLILRAILHVRKSSSGAASISAGIASAANAAATDILNAISVESVDGETFNAFAAVTAAKTQMAAPAVWDATHFLTVTGSADTTGLDATLYMDMIRVGIKPDIYEEITPTFGVGIPRNE